MGMRTAGNLAENATIHSMAPKIKTINDFKQPSFLIKSMLNCIEREYGGRDDLNFKKVCDDHKDIFGESATDTRSNFQLDWSVIKKRSFKSYIALLDELEVPPGVHTTRKIAQLGNQAYSDPDEEEEEAEEDNEKEDPTYIPEEEEKEEKETPTMSNTQAAKPAPGTPPRIYSPPRMRTPLRSPAPVEKKANQPAEDLDKAFGALNLGSKATSGCPTGDEDDPFCFEFHHKAWKHPFGFVIRQKENKKVGNRGVTVIEIFKAVSANADRWSAYVVDEGPDALRAIQFKGPALDFWGQLYYKGLKHDENDPNSKIEADYMLTAYEDEPESEKFVHYRLVFRETELWLDNQTISHHATKVKHAFRKLEAKPDQFKSRQCYEIGIAWEVAIYDDSNSKNLGIEQNSAADIW